MVAGVVFFGLELGRQPVEAVVGDPGDADLALLARPGRASPGQPLEDRALARAGKSGDADFHRCVPWRSRDGSVGYALTTVHAPPEADYENKQ